MAVNRWEELERVCEARRSDRERRFRRRAYERARDQALIALAMRTSDVPVERTAPLTASKRFRFRRRPPLAAA